MGIRELHESLGAQFGALDGLDVVTTYGDLPGECRAFLETAGVLDLSSRGRLCVVGADRHRFLHGQVTNEVAKLRPGDGCFAGLVSAKGKIEMDLHIFCLEQELLLDFEPEYSDAVRGRFEAYVIGDDVQIVDAAPFYGLASVQGPRSKDVLDRLEWGVDLPGKGHGIVTINDAALGLVYVANNPRLGNVGFDLFVPQTGLAALFERTIRAATDLGGRVCGSSAWEQTRVEAGIPRYGVDMDDSNLAPETGIERCGISYSKGCYIGQEIIARIKTYGQVAKALRVLEFADSTGPLPARGDKLWSSGGKDVGYVTSAVRSFASGRVSGMGYVRKEANEIGQELVWKSEQSSRAVKILGLPFAKSC